MSFLKANPSTAIFFLETVLNIAPMTRSTNLDRVSEGRDSSRNGVEVQNVVGHSVEVPISVRQLEVVLCGGSALLA